MAESIGLKIREPRFWDEGDLRSEVDRIFDICHSCRLCFKFCGSFPRLFELIDEKTAAKRRDYLSRHPELVAEAERRRAEAASTGASEPEDEGLEMAETFGDELPELAAAASDLSAEEIDEVVDLCFQCKLCHPNCPYTPPHEYALDFPRLLLRWKAHRVRREGVPLSARALRRPDLLGRAASLAPAVANAASRSRLGRWLMERTIGVDRRKLLPAYARESLPQWWRRHERTAAAGAPPERVDPGSPAAAVLFSTCVVDYNTPEVGRAAAAVLERNGVRLVRPEPQACCGMPRLDGGDVEAAAAAVGRAVALLQPWVERGYPILAPSPSCSLMLREEAPQLLDSEASRQVAGAVRDLCDFVFQLARAGRIEKSFSRRLGRVKYHVPCHLRVQQIGYRGRDLLRWISEGVDVVAECSGHDGTWSMMKENFEDSLHWGRKAADGMRPAPGEPCSGACSDCGLAALHLRQNGGVASVHPIVALAWAYGFDVGEASALLHEAPRSGEG